MNFKFLVLFLLTFSLQSLAYSSHPCVPRHGQSEVDLKNPDQLLEAGLYLMRNLRTFEAIECLNTAKIISPKYLDVRLALMNSFHDLGDKNSGMLEAKAIGRFGQLNEYYYETYMTYLAKLNRLTSSRSYRGYTYLDI